MKKIISFLILLIPIFGLSQVPYLGNSLYDLEKKYPNKNLKISFAKDDTKIATVETENGNYNYYFDNKTGITDYCIQFLPNNKLLNYQIEFYNKNFVVISDKNWKAYLSDGVILTINLIYDPESKLTSFHDKTF